MQLWQSCTASVTARDLDSRNDDPPGDGVVLSPLLVVVVVVTEWTNTSTELTGSSLQRIKWAQRWVDGCNTMIAQGVPSPLAEAEAQVDRWSRDRETALSRLQQLGYRARFEPSQVRST